MGAPKKHSHKLLDFLLASHNLLTDADLAVKLETTPAVISKIRSGRSPGAHVKLKIIEKLGHTIQEINALVDD